MKKRLTRNDWLKIGLASLAKIGPEALGIDALCNAAKKTRGSFYHHFKSTDEFISEMLNLWEQENTNALIEQTGSITGARNALNRLANLASDLDTQTEHAIRQLGAINTNASKICQHVDAARIGHLEKLYATSHFSQAEAKTLARVEYAAWIGLQTINPKISTAEIISIYHDFLEINK